MSKPLESIDPEAVLSRKPTSAPDVLDNDSPVPQMRRLRRVIVDKTYSLLIGYRRG